MNSKLIVLNVALAGAVVYAGVQFHDQWQAARARHAAELWRTVPPAPAPLIAPAPPPAAVLPVSYKAIAMTDLFDRSRNPDVPVEPPPTPPPPPPMPPLPVCHGVMDVGDGPMAILGVNKTSPSHAIRPGEDIGQFKLLSVNTSEIALEWNGQRITKTVDELTDRSGNDQAAAATGTGRPAPASAPPVTAPVPREMHPTGPAESTAFGYKTCSPDDSSPEGTVADGYKKVLTATPFGKACSWDPVGK